jgi:hypothetical protein
MARVVHKSLLEDGSDAVTFGLSQRARTSAEEWWVRCGLQAQQAQQLLLGTSCSDGQLLCASAVCCVPGSMLVVVLYSQPQPHSPTGGDRCAQ